MWIVLKYKSNEIKTLKDSLFKILGSLPEFYHPKIKFEKYVNNKLKIFEKNLLENYLICKHEKFSDNKIMNSLKYSRGLTYVLQGHEFNQKEINNFITFCKLNEDKSGFLMQGFFNTTKRSRAKFISGPFTQMIFDIIERKGKKIKILLNNINVTVSNNSGNLLYSCV